MTPLSEDAVRAAFSPKEWQRVTRCWVFVLLLEAGAWADAYLLGRIVLTGGAVSPLRKVHTHRGTLWVSPLGRREGMAVWTVILQSGRWIDFSLS
jgi:hypothetical protein